jgi:aspartyl-tRNA(Asn)/glutamyl-tRNA(Gln) amidotransferase subunit A
MSDILDLTLIELTEAVAEKRVSPVELMRVVLDRIDRTHEKINAVVAMVPRDQLLARAKESEARVAKGQARPLEGIPLGVKDLEDAEGLVTSEGSVPFKDNLATHDSTQVARLKAAGAIVVGKTNAPEFGSTAYTKNLLFGVTRNPWNLEFSPGGSSGGSSAALAANVLPLVTASDGGGSVRIPAVFVGAFGMKPSFGRIPLGPSDRWHWIDTVHYGPITKTVADAALFLDVVAGPSETDPNSLPPAGYSFAKKLDEPVGKLRIGVSVDFGRYQVQDEVAAAFENSVKVFEALGHRLSRLEGGPPSMQAAWVFLNNVESYCHLGHMLPKHEEEFGRGFVAGVKSAKSTSWENLEMTITRRAQHTAWLANAFEKYDVLLTPTMPYDAIPARGPYPLEIGSQKFDKTPPSAFTAPFNVSGHPAATVRSGISTRNVPMGLQIVAGRHRDDLVLQLARAFERERPWHPHWPKI